MSQDTIPVSTVGKEEGLNWKEINEALERFSGTYNGLKHHGLSLQSVARASVLSSMNLHLMETAGDPFKAMTIITEFMYNMWITMCKNLQTSMGEAVKTGKIQSQKLSEQELANIETLIVNMEMMLSANHTLSLEEIKEVLEVQQELAEFIDCRTKNHKALSVARSLIVMAQQFMFFDMQGDILSAKTAFADQQHLMWNISITNAKSLVEEAVAKTDSGSPEDKSN